MLARALLKHATLDLEPTFYTLTHPSWSLTYWFISYFLIYVTVPGWCLRAQTDQTTTLCVQEVEIYLERWEVLGALVDVNVVR